MLTFGMCVQGKEGSLGKLSGVVVDPRKREARWLAVSRKGLLWDDETRLIELKHLSAQDKDCLRLDLTEWDYSVSRTYLRLPDREWGVPADMVLLTSGVPVCGTDGTIGRLKGLQFDERHRLVQLLIKGDWLLGQDWAAPAAWIDALSSEKIHLNRSRRALREESPKSTPMAHASSRA